MCWPSFFWVGARVSGRGGVSGGVSRFCFWPGLDMFSSALQHSRYQVCLVAGVSRLLSCHASRLEFLFAVVVFFSMSCILMSGFCCGLSCVQACRFPFPSVLSDPPNVYLVLFFVSFLLLLHELLTSLLLFFSALLSSVFRVISCIVHARPFCFLFRCVLACLVVALVLLFFRFFSLNSFSLSFSYLYFLFFCFALG